MAQPIESLQKPPPRSAKRMVFGAVASGAVNLSKILLQVIMLPLMARLLGPYEYGLYAAAFPTVAFVMMLADGGLGLSLAKEPEDSPVWSSAFWLLLFTGIGLALGVCAWGFVMASVTDQPRLSGLMVFLSINLIFLTLTVCPNARLSRRGWVGYSALNEFLANLMGAIVGTICALRGAGAWSLAAQTVTIFAVRACLINLIAFHLPKFELRLKLLHYHFLTGGYMVGGRLADFGGRMVEVILITHMLGSASLGIYTIATQLPKFICESLGNIVWDLLYVQALRVERDQAIALHLKLCRLIAMALFPIAFLISSCANQLIPIFLGERWAAAAPLISTLLPTYVFVTIASQSGALLLMSGRYRVQFLCTAAASFGKIGAVCVAPWYGLSGVSYGLAGVNILYALAVALISEVEISVTPRAVFSVVYRPLISAAGAAVIYYILYSGEFFSVFPITLSIIVYIFVYVACLLILEGGKIKRDAILAWGIIRLRKGHD